MQKTCPNFEQKRTVGDKWKTVRDVKKISLREFESFCSNKDAREAMRTDIIAGDIFIILSAIHMNSANSILANIISQKNVRPGSSTRMIEGVKNIHFTSNHTAKRKGEYSSIDNSWYFFTWNPDEFGVLALFQPLFDKVIMLNGYSPKTICRNTPKDGIVQRMHLINYPQNFGEISLHYDPTNVVQINSGVYLSQYGECYNEGGFYVLNEQLNKVNVDKEVSAGDLILFYPGLAHGVSPVKGDSSRSDTIYNGRFFLNMTLVESHEKVNRAKAVGID